MKKQFFSIVLIITCFSCFLLTGCTQNTLSIDFIRLSIGQQTQNTYYMDFTIEIQNNSKNDIYIESNDFYVLINNNEINTISLLYETEETFYVGSILIKSNDELTFRVRAISTINNKDYNSILVKYEDEVIVEDNVYISNNN